MKREKLLIKKINKTNLTDTEKKELTDLIQKGKQDRSNLLTKMLAVAYGVKKLSELFDIDIGNLE
jgi:hypothetical protein